MDFLGEIEELEFASGVADGGEGADEFSDAGAVEVVDVGEVEDDFLFALGDQVANGGAESADFGTKDDASVNVEDGDVGDFAGIDGEGHVGTRGNGSAAGGASQMAGDWVLGGAAAGNTQEPRSLALLRMTNDQSSRDYDTVRLVSAWSAYEAEWPSRISWMAEVMMGVGY